MSEPSPNDEPKQCGNCLHWDGEDNGACNLYEGLHFQPIAGRACKSWMEIDSEDANCE